MRNLFSRWKGRSNDPFIPPKKLQFVGTADFVKIGKKVLRLLVEIGGLKPHHRVLDIGSGNGRLAYPLRDFLDAEKGAEYYGQEIVKEGVDWCNNAYRCYPHFNFIHANVYSKRYNRRGKYKSTEYIFPLEDEYFDFIFLTSVFTHMLKPDVQHYLHEISRLLKPAGRVFITAFLLDEESRSLLEQGKADRPFVPFRDGLFTTDPENPEKAVAYPYEDFIAMVNQAGLKLAQPALFGRWSGRKKFTAYQDIVVMEKD